LATDFCFFGVALAFIGSNTVIPSFLNTLGASPALIGLTSTLQRAGWFLPQLFAARYVANKRYKKPYVLLPASISRSLMLGLAILVWAFGAGSPSVLIPLAIVILTVFWLGDGSCSVSWFDLMSKVIPPRRRGRLTGVGQITSGVLGFLAGFVVEWMLSDRGFAFPNNYAALFLIGFLLLLVSLAAISLIVEPPGVAARDAPTWREYFPQLGRVLREDVTYRRYIIARQLFNLCMLAEPFYMTYALTRLELPAQVAGRYTSIGVLGTILAALVFSWVNEKWGTRRTIYLNMTLMMLTPISAMVIPALITDIDQLAWGYGLVFLVLNLALNGLMPSWLAFMLELAPEAERPIYVGLTNTLNGVTALFSALGGLILAWTNENYIVLFGITLVGMMLAWPLALTLPEPRDLEGQRQDEG
jgi:MFS family permease